MISFITPSATSLRGRQEEAEAQRLESETCLPATAADDDFLHFHEVVH